MAGTEESSWRSCVPRVGLQAQLPASQPVSGAKQLSRLHPRAPTEHVSWHGGGYGHIAAPQRWGGLVCSAPRQQPGLRELAGGTLERSWMVTGQPWRGACLVDSVWSKEPRAPQNSSRGSQSCVVCLVLEAASGLGATLVL